jgi:hypothetical protein
MEKLICGDPQLSQLALAYRRALEGAADPDRLRDGQRTWLRTDRKACADAACLKKVYAQRLAALAAAPGPEGTSGQGPVESAPVSGGSVGAFTLAPVLDKAKGQAAVAAYFRRAKARESAHALASGSFTRAGADEVLLVVSRGTDFTGSPINNTLVTMQNTASLRRRAQAARAPPVAGTLTSAAAPAPAGAAASSPRSRPTYGTSPRVRRHLARVLVFPNSPGLIDRELLLPRCRAFPGAQRCDRISPAGSQALAGSFAESWKEGSIGPTPDLDRSTCKR